MPSAKTGLGIVYVKTTKFSDPLVNKKIPSVWFLLGLKPWNVR